MDQQSLVVLEDVEAHLNAGGECESKDLDMECSLGESLREHPLDQNIAPLSDQAESLFELAYVLGVLMEGREDEVHQFVRDLLTVESFQIKQNQSKLSPRTQIKVLES